MLWRLTQNIREHESKRPKSYQPHVSITVSQITVFIGVMYNAKIFSGYIMNNI
jgi:hypothetical protein